MSFSIYTKNLWLHAVSIKKHGEVMTEVDVPDSIWHIQEASPDSEGVWFYALVKMKPHGILGFASSLITEITTKGGVVLKDPEDIMNFLEELP